MSTRSIIGTAHDGGFTGRYCHWDGYPTAKVAQLRKTFQELGSWKQVRDYAIRAENGYWSSFGAPSFVAAQEAKPEKVSCRLCAGTGNRTDIKLHKANWCNGCDGTGQARNTERTDTWIADGTMPMTQDDDCGGEWAYLLDERGITVLESRYRDDNSKAIGMFGSLNGNHYWAHVEILPWVQVDPQDIEKAECGERFERCCHYAFAHFPEAEGTTIGIREWLETHPLLPSADIEYDEQVPF